MIHTVLYVTDFHPTAETKFFTVTDDPSSPNLFHCIYCDNEVVNSTAFSIEDALLEISKAKTDRKEPIFILSAEMFDFHKLPDAIAKDTYALIQL